MSAEDNLATVQGIYEAFGKGDVPAILDQLTDDVDWAAEASSDAVPWYGMRKGKDEVVGFFYWHFRDGKVDHYRGTEDTAATLAMLGK